MKCEIAVFKITIISDFRVNGEYTRCHCNGSFTLMEKDSGIDSDSHSKPDGYVILCTTFHTAQTWTRIPTPCFSVGQESECGSVSRNVNEP